MVGPNWRAGGLLKKGTFSDFSTSIVAKHQKIEEGPFVEKNFSRKIFKAVSQCRKTQGETIWEFSTSILSQKKKL